MARVGSTGGGTTALSGCVAARSGPLVSAGAVSMIVSEREMLVGADCCVLIGFPHCGQNIACSRTDTPQNEQRRAISISGSDIRLILKQSCQSCPNQMRCIALNKSSRCA